MKKIFLYRVKDTDDRDRCAYIEADPCRFECGHYFGRVILHGACYCNSDWAPYEEIETVLSRKEYIQLREFDEKIRDLGYGIKKDSEEYQKGMELCAWIQPVFDKLHSQKAQEFFGKIITDEKSAVMDEYDFTEDEVDAIFDNYPLEYQDCSIIQCVYDDAYYLGEDMAENSGDIPNWMEPYIDYEKLGKDIAYEGDYYTLDDDRIVAYAM